MKYPLAKERKSSPTVSYAFNQLQFVDFSLHQAV